MFVVFRQEHQMEIAARANTFQVFEGFGQNLLQSKHYARQDISSKLDELTAARQTLERSVGGAVL